MSPQARSFLDLLLESHHAEDAFDVRDGRAAIDDEAC
jgi:hypothetical protein